MLVNYFTGREVEMSNPATGQDNGSSGCLIVFLAIIGAVYFVAKMFTVIV